METKIKVEVILDVKFNGEKYIPEVQKEIKKMVDGIFVFHFTEFYFIRIKTSDNPKKIIDWDYEENEAVK